MLAKFSLPFTLATTIVNGAASIPAFRDPARDDEVTRALARRVTVKEDPVLTSMLPSLRPARATIHMKDGRTLKAEALTNKGDAEDPYSDAEIREKFHEITGAVWDAAILAVVDTLDAPRVCRRSRTSWRAEDEIAGLPMSEGDMACHR